MPGRIDRINGENTYSIETTETAEMLPPSRRPIEMREQAGGIAGERLSLLRRRVYNDISPVLPDESPQLLAGFSGSQICLSKPPFAINGVKVAFKTRTSYDKFVLSISSDRGTNACAVIQMGILNSRLVMYRIPLTNLFTHGLRTIIRPYSNGHIIIRELKSPQE